MKRPTHGSVATTSDTCDSLLDGWGRLRHGGLLLDRARLEGLASVSPPALDGYTEQQLRRRAAAVLNGDGSPSSFAEFVLERVCGLDGSEGDWSRGPRVAPDWGRREVTGTLIKPSHLWEGAHGALFPVFLYAGDRVGIGKGRRFISQVLGWLRVGGNHLALITNGRQWRLLFAGLDYDAWCEWDIDHWFDGGALAPQVTVLRTLLGAKLWIPPTANAASPLLQYIRDTRKGQAELSEVLGERVREAVEILIRGHGEALHDQCSDVDRADIYRAACRMAMRLVVILFAESRDLLPRDNALYHQSYGLNGLIDQLDLSASADRFSAWPRILGLFQIVREGSHHPELPTKAYGGALFEPGTADSPDGLLRALAVFEDECFTRPALSDMDVHAMLRCLTRTKARIRQGRGTTQVTVPVDFSDLSSEYIGILYEGLLDYELKVAPCDDPVIFLAVGDQPALPLSRLEAMDKGAIKALFESLQDKSDPEMADELVGGVDTASESEDLEVDDLEEPVESDSVEFNAEVDLDPRFHNQARARKWARYVAVEIGLVRKPRDSASLERKRQFNEKLEAKAKRLVGRDILPGDWYLVRWGGTRKGSGSFYTRPGLAVPTVQRTLRPLAYDPPKALGGIPDLEAPAALWIPKTPEKILALTVCDPACGSGTFLLAALRFLTDALYASIQHHERIQPDSERSLIRLLGPEGGGGFQ